MAKRHSNFPAAIAESIAELSRAIDATMPPAEPINHNAWMAEQEAAYEQANCKARARREQFLNKRVRSNWKRY